MSVIPIYSNINGTTSESFSLGIQGPVFLKGAGIPIMTANNGSMYLSTAGSIYRKNTTGWAELATIYRTNFTSAGLTNGIITINHNLGNQYVNVQVYDNNNKIIIPDDVIANSITSITLDVHSYSVNGTWRVVVTG